MTQFCANPACGRPLYGFLELFHRRCGSCQVMRDCGDIFRDFLKEEKESVKRWFE